MLLPLPLRPTIPKNSPSRDRQRHVVERVQLVDVARAERVQRALLERRVALVRQPERLRDAVDRDRGRRRGRGARASSSCRATVRCTSPDAGNVPAMLRHRTRLSAALCRGDPRLGGRVPRRDGRQRRAAGDPRGPRRRASRRSSGSSRRTCSRSASLLLVGGSLGDLLGRRRVFMAGLAGFGATSALCAVAPNAGAADRRARRCRASPGALLVPSSLALITAIFSGEERGAAIGSWTAWTGIAFVARAARRRRADRVRLLALDLRDQRPARARDAVARRASVPESRDEEIDAAGSTTSARCSSRSASPGRCSR